MERAEPSLIRAIKDKSPLEQDTPVCLRLQAQLCPALRLNNYFPNRGIEGTVMIYYFQNVTSEIYFYKIVKSTLL